MRRRSAGQAAAGVFVCADCLSLARSRCVRDDVARTSIRNQQALLSISLGIRRGGLLPMTWREYHEATKHSVESLRRTQHALDWENMPDPFRHYEGVPVLDLPADPPPPELSALEVLAGDSGTTRAREGTTFLSQLLFHSAAISASKRVSSAGSKYALRVNPSSGNLHPTEFHFITKSLNGWRDGLYHYRPSSHTAEQRAMGAVGLNLEDNSAQVSFLLSSIAWREAWKYGERAYRYCLLDIGHAWQALALAARAMGCESVAIGQIADEAVAKSCRLEADEWPMLIVQLRGAAIPLGPPDVGGTIWYGGRANQISKEVIPYASIRAVHYATMLDKNADRSISVAAATSAGSGEILLPAPATSQRSFGEVVRVRRSALDFQGGAHTISLAQLSAILGAASAPNSGDFADARFIQLYVYAHRVEGLTPGVYRLWPERSALERIKGGDQQVAAAGLSLSQELAGNACVAFSMIADLDRATRAYGERGYRCAHFEAGAIGHRLYLAAVALGLGGTGIGAFYDDEVHRYLNVPPEQGQVIYHFAIGYPVPDPRIEASRLDV